MKTDNLSEVRRRLWNSMEMAYVRLQIIAWLTGYGVCLLVCCPRAAEYQAAPMIAAFVSIVFLPFVGFWLWRVFAIFSSAQEYVFCRTELNQPHYLPLSRGTFTFMGTIETEEDGRFAVETHAIFQSHGIGAPLMEDYVGKTVTLAWNRETEMVVVIG